MPVLMLFPEVVGLVILCECILSKFSLVFMLYIDG